jgi:hypothetical protein
MSTTGTKLLGLAVVALALLCLPARADTITVNNVQFTASVTSNLATLQIQCLDTSICGDWYLGDVTLKGFTFTGTPTLGIAPGGYTLSNGGQNNSAVGNGGGCNLKDLGGALCWNTTTPLSLHLGGSLLTFTANIAGGTIGTDGLHVQATAYNNPEGSQLAGGKVLAVSNDLTGGTGGEVPEPGSMALFGAGLMTVGGVLRYRMKFEKLKG